MIKKILMLMVLLGIVTVGCGKPKMKTYTMAQKEVYLEKANNGDKEAEDFIQARMDEADKIYKETRDPIANREWNEWAKMMMRINVGMPEKDPAW